MVFNSEAQPAQTCEPAAVVNTAAISTLGDVLKAEYGKVMSRGNIHLVLKNQFYVGFFEWAGETYPATHQLFIDPKTFHAGSGAYRSQPSKVLKAGDCLPGGLMTCAHDGCVLTGSVQKQKYVYYCCTGNRGKCDLPRFKDEVLSERLGEPLKGLQVPPEIVVQIMTMLHEDQSQVENRLTQERAQLEFRLTSIRNRMDFT